MTKIADSNALPDAVFDDVSHLFSKAKLGLVQKGGRLVIVAEADTVTGNTLWVEAVPTFTLDQTEVIVEFWLFGHLNGQRAHTTVSPGVVESALRGRQCVMSAAALDQYGWLERNFPDMAAVIYEAHQSRLTPSAPKSGKSTTL